MPESVGRPKLIPIPFDLWSLFEDYKSYTKSKPRIKKIFSQKLAEFFDEELEVPYTREGFYNYCANYKGISTLKDYFSNKEDRYAEFATICARILDEIRQDQIEGGMVGQYNPSITQRLNGLVEKTDNKTEIDLKGSVSPDKWLQENKSE